MKREIKIETHTTNSHITGYTDGASVQIENDTTIYPLYTPKTFAKKVKEDKQVYLTAFHAFFLQDSISEKDTIIGCLGNANGDAPYALIYQLNRPFNWLETQDLDYYCADKKDLDRAYEREHADKYEYFGHFFDEKKGRYYEMYSVKKYMKEHNMPFAKELKKGIIFEKHLKKVKEVKEKKFYAGFIPRNFKLMPAFDVEGYCKSKGLEFIYAEDLSYPYFPESVFRLVNEGIYKGKHAGYLYKFDEVVRFYHLEELCKQNNIKLFEKKIKKSDLFLEYLTPKERKLFPNEWNLTKKIQTLGFLKDGTEVSQFPGGVANCIATDAPTNSDLVVSYENFEKFTKRVKKEGLSLGEMEPRALTKEGEFIFDTRLNKEWSKFRIRYLLNPL